MWSLFNSAGSYLWTVFKPSMTMLFVHYPNWYHCKYTQSYELGALNEGLLLYKWKTCTSYQINLQLMIQCKFKYINGGINRLLLL